jgi:hypothetical protein
MKNWRTTVCGLVAAIAAYVVANPSQFVKWPWAGTVAGIVMASGILGVGATAKDSSTHSTEAEVKVSTIKANSAIVKSLNY